MNHKKLQLLVSSFLDGEVSDSEKQTPFTSKFDLKATQPMIKVKTHREKMSVFCSEQKLLKNKILIVFLKVC